MTPGPRSLLDLPNDVLRAYVYQILLSHHPGYRSGDLARLRDLRRYRLTCKAFRDLIDSGVTTFSCDLGPTLSRTTPAYPNWSLLQRFFRPRARTPLLGLRGWASEATLASQLQRLGRATAAHRGPTCLHLTGSRLTSTALTAVRCSLPYLRELHIADTAVSSHPGLEHLYPNLYPMLKPSLFESLQAGQLTKLTYHNPTAEARQHGLRGLGDLSRLVHLDLTLGFVDSEGLHHLSGLDSLAFCSIVSVNWAGEFCDYFAGLLHGSRALASLRLHGWVYLGIEPKSPLFSVLLGHLTRLRSLDLRPDFMVDDELWDHLSRLTQLTMLAVTALRLSQVRTGCLPLLQHLAIAACVGDDDVTPMVGLHRSLLPLLPLPSLVRLDITHLCHGHEHLHQGAMEAAALNSFVRLLADAPRLHLEGNWHFSTDSHEHHLTHAQLAGAMLPLEGRVTFTEGM